MKEIRIQGRGGQGTVLAAELIVVAAFEDGTYGQAFPAFGGERRGAPVQAFVRLDDQPVRVRFRVNQPDYVIILDRTLPNMVDVLQGLKPDGLAMIDSEKSPDTLSWSADAQVITVPATRIALEVFGQPFVNPAMLGAWSAATGEISMEAVQRAYLHRFPGMIGEKNSRAVKIGFDYVQAGAKPVTVHKSDKAIGGVIKWEREEAAGVPGQPLHFASVVAARTSLAYPTGTWRYNRPVVDEVACNGCSLCKLFCPDSSIMMDNKLVVIDYEFCKGCGICAQVCPRDAIDMVIEEE